MVELPPGYQAGNCAHTHDGEEWIMVLTGKVKVIQGDFSAILEDGDCIHWDGSHPHLCQNATDTPSKVIVALTPPAMLPLSKTEQLSFFCTSNQKEVYKQLASNPDLEICAMSESSQWIRVQGKAVFDSDIAAKVKAFEIMPNLARIYNTPDNPTFEVFYISEGEATVYSFSDEPRTVKF